MRIGQLRRQARDPAGDGAVPVDRRADQGQAWAARGGHGGCADFPLCSDRLERVEHLARGLLPGEFGRALRAISAQLGLERRIGQDPLHPRPDRGRIDRIDQQVHAVDHLGQRSRGRCDHRRPARHRLQGRQPESFAQRREGEQGAFAIERDQILVRHTARQDERIRGQPLAAHQLGKIRARLRIHPARDHDLVRVAHAA